MTTTTTTTTSTFAHNVQLGKVNVSAAVPSTLHVPARQLSTRTDGCRLAAVAGTQEPEYGPEAIQPVGKKGDEPAYTQLTKDHLKWETLDYTNVETQTFYFFSDAGHKGFLQVIYNNIA